MKFVEIIALGICFMYEKGLSNVIDKETLFENYSEQNNNGFAIWDKVYKVKNWIFVNISMMFRDFS